MLNLKKMLTKIGETLSSLDGRPYIVEQSVVNNNYYRKWSDGTLEQWGNATLSATSGNASGSVSTPVSFVDTNFTVVLSQSSNMTNMVTSFSECNSAGNRNRTASTFSVTAYKTGHSYQLSYGWYAIGKWK